MWTKQKRKTHKSYFIIFLIVILIFYFAYHLCYGKYGIFANNLTEQHIETLQKELDALVQNRKQLQKKNLRLQDGTIEQDMLEEYALKNLDLMHEDEVIIFLDKNNNN